MFPKIRRTFKTLLQCNVLFVSHRKTQHPVQLKLKPVYITYIYPLAFHLVCVYVCEVALQDFSCLAIITTQPNSLGDLMECNFQEAPQESWLGCGNW